jgi:hypothetical protein
MSTLRPLPPTSSAPRTGLLHVHRPSWTRRCRCVPRVRPRKSPSATDGRMCASVLFPSPACDLTLTQTTIRIRFSDRTLLEKVFPSNSKIRSVYAFVRASLHPDVQAVKFVLCASPRFFFLASPNKFFDGGVCADQPPKRDLKVSDPGVRDLTLSELYLAPSSVLLLRFEDATQEKKAYALNGIHFPS